MVVTQATDAIDFSWSDGYSFNRNMSLVSAETISNTNIVSMEIHNPTSLIPTNVKFGGEIYQKYFPVMVCRIHYSEDIFVGCTITVTDNHTSAGATASEVIFKGTVQKRIIIGHDTANPLYLVYSNASEMDDIYPLGSYTVDTDGYISSIITNLCDSITAGTLTDGEDLGTFTAGGEKNFTRIIDTCCRMDGYIEYIDPSAGAGNAQLEYNAGGTDTGVDIDESTANIFLFGVEDIDEHINYVLVRGGIKADGTRAVGTPAEDPISQTTYGINKFYDVDSNLITDAACTTKASQILAQNQYGRKKVKLRYSNATEGMLQHGENVTFDWDSSVKNIGFDIYQDQYIIAYNIYNVKSGENKMILMSGIYYPPLTTDDKVSENAQMIQQVNSNVATNTSTLAGLKGSRQLMMKGGGGATVSISDGNAYTVLLDASGEYVLTTFTIDETIDASADINITVTFRDGSGGDATAAGLLYVSATKTDGSEARTWNIENGTAETWTMSGTADRYFTYTYTLANADFDADDLIVFQWNLNEAGHSIRINNVQMTYGLVS